MAFLAGGHAQECSVEAEFQAAAQVDAEHAVAFGPVTPGARRLEQPLTLSHVVDRFVLGEQPGSGGQKILVASARITAEGICARSVAS